MEYRYRFNGRQRVSANWLTFWEVTFTILLHIGAMMGGALLMILMFAVAFMIPTL